MKKGNKILNELYLLVLKDKLFGYIDKSFRSVITRILILSFMSHN